MFDSLGELDPNLREVLEESQLAFARGLAAEYTDFYDGDALLLIHNQPAIRGKEAIRATFKEVFDHFDTSAYTQTYEVAEIHDRHAYVVSRFQEVLRPRDGGSGTRIHGRLVLFLHRRDDGPWRITMALTGRSAPEEPEQEQA